MGQPLTVEQAVEAIYTSVNNDNEDIDIHIGNLKQALAANGQKEAKINTGRLIHNNREGRKMMQSYFKRRGVAVVFEA